ncbi:MAG: O-antigen ligase family protein [Candidatus Saccharimonadales bacterium]
MRVSALKYTVLSWATTLVMVIILAMPFHAFLTVWGASLIGHYTALRLWKEVLLLLCGLGVLLLLATDHKIRSHTLTRRLVRLILLYGLVNLIWGLVALKHHAVDLKALGYGLIINLRFLFFFLITWASALRLARLRIHWQWMILWPAGLVVLFGLLQIFVLPRDFLRHFGYGPNTILPFSTINHDSHYVRIASTLRGPNPLGAYLLIPITLLTILLLRGKRLKLYSGLLAASLLVLFFSFSRGAWIGAALSITAVVLLSARTARLRRATLAAIACLLVVSAALVVGLHHNARFQNFVFHTQDHSAVKISSNEDHFSALKSGLRDVIHEPLGRGPGTAGPASIYNTGHPARIAENYYVQIGQETGWLGLSLFVLIVAGVGYLLWLRRDHSLALALFASLIGLSFVSLLSHGWTDDTLAYVWWGLAGIAMAPGLNKEE